MRAISVLFGGRLGEEAFVSLIGPGAGGKSAFNLALERAGNLPYTEKTVLLGLEGQDYPRLPQEGPGFSLVRKENWSRRQVLEAISQLQTGFDIAYFAWADCPFLDPELAKALADLHKRYAAEYSYADGFPYGFAPELLSPGTAGILFNIDKDGDIPLERDALFQVIQKDINAFDIETEISPEDLRLYRLNFTADSQRNLLLISRWLEASKGIPPAKDAVHLIKNQPELLRTLPAFYNIQVFEGCPQSCAFCPWPKTSDTPVISRKAFVEKEQFRILLDKIADFSNDAVISLSLWGELALHPQKMELIRMVLERPSLSLVIETSGIGWKQEELETLAAAAAQAPQRKSKLLTSPLSWVVSLDAHDAGRYRDIRGPGYNEAVTCVKLLLGLFPKNSYVQAVRVKGSEDDIELFYRSWKDLIPQGNASNQIIIQKYDDFCGKLPKLQASDLSPVKRRPCWHIMRDLSIGLDGTVLVCREDLDSLTSKKGPNVFETSLEEIWESGRELYLEHSRGIYPGLCADCDEYYTYNF